MNCRAHPEAEEREAERAPAPAPPKPARPPVRNTRHSFDRCCRDGYFFCHTETCLISRYIEEGDVCPNCGDKMTFLPPLP